MTLRTPVLFLTLVLALTAGCGSCGRSASRDGGAANAAAPVVAPPAGLTAEVGVDDLGALLAALRLQTSPEVARMLFPDNAVAVVEQRAPIPEALRPHIPANARMRGLMVKIGDGMHEIFAVRVTRNADAAHPLGAEIALVDGAPHGAKWVMAAPATGAPAIALLDDVLVIGDDTTVLETALPYLVNVAMRADVGPGMRMRMAPGALGGPLRAVLDNAISAQSESAIAAAREERARHEEAPAFGEPEQVVTMARDDARRLLAYLPDAGEVIGTLRVLPHGIDFDLRVAVTAGTPLAREVAGLAAGVPFGVAALPRTIALARSTQYDEHARALEGIIRLAGDRLPAADRAKLEAAETALRASAGPAHVLGLGGGVDGAYLLYGAAARATPFDAETLRTALALPFVSGTVGSVIGCPALTPTPIRDDAPSALCRRSEGPFPQLEVLRAEGVLAIALETARTANAPHPAPRAFVAGIARPGTGTLGESPDVARALTALGQNVVTTIVVVPTNLVPSLGFFDVPILRRIAMAPAGDETLAPTFLAVTRETDGVHFRVIVTPHGADQLFQVGFLASQLMMTQ